MPDGPSEAEVRDASHAEDGGLEASPEEPPLEDAAGGADEDPPAAAADGGAAGGGGVSQASSSSLHTDAAAIALGEDSCRGAAVGQ